MVAPSAKRATSTGGRIAATVFFCIFGAFGLFFCGLLLREIYQSARTYAWVKTPCVVLESKVTTDTGRSNSRYGFSVKYQYAWAGKEMISEQYGRKATTFSQYDEAQALAQKFRVDTHSVCYVNPENPREALLQRPNFWVGLFILIPLIFVAVGVIGIYSTWSKGKSKDDAAEPKAMTAMSSGGSRVFLAGFFLIFFLAGSLVAWFLAIRPTLKNLQAKSWPATPCTILSSRVQSHSGSKGGTTYSVDILYTYEFQAQEYKSSRYDFIPGSSSGREGKAQIVRRYPAGLKTSCFVNPSAPHEAVLSRSFRAQMWWGILFPIPFIAIGLGGLIFTLRKKSNSDSSSVTAKANRKWGNETLRFPMKQSTPVETGQRVLKPRSRFATLIFLIIFAAFWNSILSVFVWQVIQSWLRHRPEWFLTFFMIPFVLIGLGVIFAVVYQFLALFNPRVELKLHTETPQLGDRLDLQWELRGQTSRIKKLRIYLEGREEVTYRRGTSTSTDRAVFATFMLASVEASGNMDMGQAQVRIPSGTMHSLNSANNKIIWVIHVQGDIPFWPDMKDEYPVTIAPLPAEQISSL